MSATAKCPVTRVTSVPVSVAAAILHDNQHMTGGQRRGTRRQRVDPTPHTLGFPQTPALAPRPLQSALVSSPPLPPKVLIAMV
ncbi:unnamed protein product [Gadus morhua 'NCC']